MSGHVLLTFFTQSSDSCKIKDGKIGVKIKIAIYELLFINDVPQAEDGGWGR